MKSNQKWNVNPRKHTNQPNIEQQESIRLAKENIYKQAGLAGLAIVVTIVLIFAMSVAWYSNVIHNEGLVFQASSWDFEFEGNIEFDESTNEIAPGENGIVNLKLINESDDAITVFVNMVKDDNMTVDMKKRIYCYADDSKIENGELVERIYINESNEYEYTVLGKNTLLLSEEYHSHPYLKWEWVYDVVGYYVTGTMDESGNLIIEDYMRPINYEYDKATYDSNGNLLTVDEGMSKEDYLEELYATDGYEGDIVPAARNGYYPVAIDSETNSGVWLYLCTEGEIEAENATDTQLGLNAKDGIIQEIVCRLLISGQNMKENTMTVSNEKDLAEQINTMAVNKVVLAENISLTNTLELRGGRSVVLDLNGNTLSLPNNTAIEIPEGNSLTVINGTMKGSSNTVALHCAGGVLTMDNVIIENSKRAIYVEDDKSGGLDSRVRLTNCKIDVSDVAVFLRGNAEVSASNTKTVIEKCTIYGGSMGIVGNGSSWGTDIEIIESTVEGYWAGIYHPQKSSTLLVKDSTITGYTAIAIKAGEVSVVDSAVEGTGAKNAPAFSNSGFTDTGDAIYIETNYNEDISLTVTGDKTNISSRDSEAIQVFEVDASHIDVNVLGGKYNSDITSFIPEGYVTIERSDGYWIVAPEPAG